MASIKRRPDGMWRARYRDDAGREHSRHFARKVDGQAWLDEITAAVITGRYVDPRAGKVTFTEYAAHWQAAQVHRPNTALAVDSALRVHAIPRFGPRPIGAIQPTEVQAWVKLLSQSLAPSTVRVTYQHFRSVMRAAVLDRLIPVSPCEQIKLPTNSTKVKVRPLETSVVLGAADRMPERWAALVTLMAGTGLRPGEAAGVTLPQIDMLRRQLVVDRQLLLSRPPSFGPPKTASSERTVPFGDVVAQALAAHLAAFGTGEYDLVFTNPFGAPVNRDQVGRDFKTAALAAGGPTSARLHDLRHYYASLLIRHGEDIKTVQDRLGHASAKETLDTYSHLWPDSEDRTRAAVDSVLNRRSQAGAGSGSTSGIGDAFTR